MRCATENATTMKIRIVTPHVPNAQGWSAALQQHDRSIELSIDSRTLQQVNVLVNGSRPDMLVAEVTSPADFDALERLAAAHPEVDCVLIAANPSPEMLLRAM